MSLTFTPSLVHLKLLLLFNLQIYSGKGLTQKINGDGGSKLCAPDGALVLIQFDCKITVRKVMKIVMKNTLLFIQNISLILTG